MKFINPVGRKIGDGIRSLACMCPNSRELFQATRGNHDHCFHCGCHCDPSGAYRTGNTVNATRTIRSS